MAYKLVRDQPVGYSDSSVPQGKTPSSQRGKKIKHKKPEGPRECQTSYSNNLHAVTFEEYMPPIVGQRKTE